MTFEWVVSNCLRNILLSSEVSTKNLSWALDKTYDAIRADDAMQDADEIEGVDDNKEYQYLMLKIAQVAFARLQTSMENAP